MANRTYISEAIAAPSSTESSPTSEEDGSDQQMIPEFLNEAFSAKTTP
jgi:hypothetical protein